MYVSRIVASSNGSRSRRVQNSLDIICRVDSDGFYWSDRRRRVNTKHPEITAQRHVRVAKRKALDNHPHSYCTVYLYSYVSHRVKRSYSARKGRSVVRTPVRGKNTRRGEGISGRSADPPPLSTSPTCQRVIAETSRTGRAGAPFNWKTIRSRARASRRSSAPYDAEPIKYTVYYHTGHNTRRIILMVLGALIYCPWREKRKKKKKQINK